MYFEKFVSKILFQKACLECFSCVPKILKNLFQIFETYNLEVTLTENKMVIRGA